MLGIVMRCYRKDKFLFKPDRDYLHYILQRAGLSSRQTLVVVLVFAALMSLIGALEGYFQAHEGI